MERVLIENNALLMCIYRSFNFRKICLNKNTREPLEPVTTFFYKMLHSLYERTGEEFPSLKRLFIHKIAFIQIFVIRFVYLAREIRRRCTQSE